MKNPAELIPGVLLPLPALAAASDQSGAAPATILLVHSRVSLERAIDVRNTNINGGRAWRIEPPTGCGAPTRQP